MEAAGELQTVGASGTATVKATHWRMIFAPAASTAAGVIGGGLLLNSNRSMFGEHERSPFGTSDLAHAAGTDSINRADLAQKDRDQDQDQDQDDQDQEDKDQDQDQDQDFTDDGGGVGGEDTDYA